MPFNDPGTGGDKLPLDELNGSLLLITVHEVVKDIPTSFGDTDAIRADVAALDGPLKASEYADTLIFPRVLQSQLRGSVGSMVIGRLGQGVKKPGQSPPWTLSAATDAEKATGERYLEHIAKTRPVVVEDDEAPF
jgi:hypothetical protein